MAMQQQASAYQSSTQRPIPLYMRDDLVIKRIEYRGAGYFVIKDPLALKYHRLQPEQFTLLKMLNGQASLENLKDALQIQYPTAALRIEDVQRIVTDLHQKGLIYSLRPGQGISLLKRAREEKRKKWLSALTSVLYIRLPGWDPQWVLDLLYPYVRWMYSPAGIAGAAVLVVSAWLLILSQFDVVRARIPEFQQFFGWPNLLYLWVVLGGAKIIHEFGHGMSCKHYGSECHEMGLLLLVFSPSLYCDATDSWLLRNKWQRIVIGAAGMYIEVILSAIAVFGWYFTLPGLLNHLCLNLFFVSTITTVIFNANPFMRGDGYYMFSDWLEIPNLQQKASRLMQETFAWYCLGIEPKPDPFLPQGNRGWFVAYAVFGAFYRWFVLFGIVYFLCTVLKPYGLQSIGIMAAVASVGSILFQLGWGLTSILRTPREDPLSYPKIAVTLTLLGTAVYLALAFPLSMYVQAAFMVEPRDVQHIYAAVPGNLVEQRVRPGDVVKEGDLLVRLSDPALEEEVLKLRLDRDKQVLQCQLYHALDDVAQGALAAEKLASLEVQLREAESRLAKLEIYAPRGGKIIAAHRVPPPKRDVSGAQLGNWHGTVLDPSNLGAHIPVQTPLFDIAPNDGLQTVVLVDQGDRNDLEPGQYVEFKFDHLPLDSYSGHVAAISDRHLEFAPKELSNKLGGDLPTVTDQQGREKLVSTAYQATTYLDKDPDLMLTGLRGQARFLVAKRSAAEWIWRALRKTFHFQL